MDALALVLTVAAMAMFAFAAVGRELRRFNEIAVGLVFLSAALICQFTSITNTHIAAKDSSGPPASLKPHGCGRRGTIRAVHRARIRRAGAGVIAPSSVMLLSLTAARRKNACAAEGVI